ncbi:MAG TPA: ABC transporter substrate-binding protein [Dehalococcoidia bacterium]|nr:ABC transporter substrate-binding protein [Dehalococcoidia bacterium]
MAFWERYTAQRVARRKVIGGVAAVSASAAFLAACGGGSDNNSSSSSGGSSGSSAATGASGASGASGATGASGAPGTTTGLLYNPGDSTAQAKPGGTLKDYSRDEGGSFDVLSSGDSTTYGLLGDYTYPALVKFNTGKYPNQPKGDVTGDLAESWEYAPDKMSITFKLRQGLKWDNKAPVNAREIDAQDVVASWKKFSTTSSYAGQAAYSPKNPNASIVSMDALDTHTVKVNLFRPDPSAMSLLGWTDYRIMPREFDGGFNPASEVIGYGPYLLSDYKPSIGFTWQKNPDYYEKDRPFIDRIERPIVPEYAAQLAQFRAGNIYTSVAQPEDLIQTKKDQPKTLLLIGAPYIPYNGVNMKFGYEGDGAKFVDIRIRQAVNYLIDRMAYQDVLTNGKQLSAQGIDLEARLATWIGPFWEDWWLNPFDASKFGPNSKYFQFNPDEAKKLLTAAGYADGFTTGFFFPSGRNGFQQQLNDIMPGLLEVGGIKCNSEGVDNTAVFIPNMLRQYAGGKRQTGKATDGLQMIAGGTRVTAALCLQNYYDQGGPSYIGMPVNGGGPEQGDADIQSLMTNLLGEFDHDKQASLSHDFHKTMAEKAYSLPLHWTTPGLQLVWPVVGNLGYFTQSAAGGLQAESHLQWWIDSTKAPLA